MAKQKEHAETNNEQVADGLVPVEKENTNEVSNITGSSAEILQISEDAYLTPEQMDLLLKNDNTLQENLSAEYLGGDSFEKGEEKKFIIVGFKEIDGVNDQKAKAVKLYADNKNFLLAASIVVGECETLPRYSTVGLQYLGKKKGKNGFSYDNFRVIRYHHLAK